MMFLEWFFVQSFNFLDTGLGSAFIYLNKFQVTFEMVKSVYCAQYIGGDWNEKCVKVSTREKMGDDGRWIWY